MNIDKSISSECVVCKKSVELHDHYYGIGLVRSPSKYKYIVAPLYYNEIKYAGYCSPQCSTIDYNSK